MTKKSKGPKIEIVRPTMGKKEVGSQAKKNVAVVKRDAKAENIYQAYVEIERTIQELTKSYVEAEDSKHYGVSGTMKPTQKQMVIQAQLDKANERAKELIKKLD
jgi:hypothetical protein